jgi:hypothetical protein
VKQIGRATEEKAASISRVQNGDTENGENIN